MTVREYRRGDWVGVADLWRRNPTDEFPVVGLRPEAVGRVVQRMEGAGIRLVLRLARWVGRPVVVILVDEVEGRIVATTVLNFVPGGMYVSGVVVDEAFRRQGRARAMLEIGERFGRRYRRPNVVLDVLAQNAPAIALYEHAGFGRLREVRWMIREFGAGRPLPTPSGAAHLRPFRPADGRRLAEIDNRRMSPAVRAVLPRTAREFRVGTGAAHVLESDSQAWVLEVDGQPAGYLRATVSRLMAAANLSSPLFADSAPMPAVRDAILTALRWVEQRNAARAITWLPDHQDDRLPVLTELGFSEQFHDITMLHRLTA